MGGCGIQVATCRDFLSSGWAPRRRVRSFGPGPRLAKHSGGRGGQRTGIIDWDLVQTLPRCVGYCRYPSWITRDWDPLMYGWPKIKESENSPEELQRYREHFDREMGAALGWKGDWIYTKKSHIREAVWIAALNARNRLEICRKMVEVVIGGQEEKADDALGMIYDIGSGYLGEQEWRDLKQKLETLVS